MFVCYSRRNYEFDLGKGDLYASSTTLGVDSTCNFAWQPLSFRVGWTGLNDVTKPQLYSLQPQANFGRPERVQASGTEFLNPETNQYHFHGQAIVYPLSKWSFQTTV